jgi:predicted DNA binding CopG/RHH family protein
MKRISVFLTEQQIAALQALAKETGLKFAELLRRIVDKALEEQHEKDRGS